MMTNEEIREQARRLNAYVIDCRRALHRLAEIGGTEVKTSAFLQDQIKKMGLPYEMAGETGLIATLDTGKPGPHIALRADIDALPVKEEPNNLAGPRVCVSDDPKTCHACGHDAHMGMLLGAMQALVACREKLTGVIYFCFEEGEENGRGWPAMMEAMGKKKIDTCWGIHVYAGLDSGKICVMPGPRMAGYVMIDMKVIGKGGHGSRPDMACNPVFCSAAILTNVATAWVNQISAGQTVTMGITSIQGGEVSNVIPESAHILGSLRFFSRKEGEKAITIFKSVAEHTAAMNKCRVEYASNFGIVGYPVINDTHYAELAGKVLPEVLPEGAVVTSEPWYASDSFAMYCERYPSVYAHLGINNPKYGSGAAHHNGFFDVDESVMELGLLSTLKYVAAVQQEASKKGDF